MGTIHPNAIGTTVNAAALHLKQNGPHRRVLMVHILAIHVGAFEVATILQLLGLVVGMTVNNVVNEANRPRWKGVQGFDEFDQLVRTQAFED